MADLGAPAAVRWRAAAYNIRGFGGGFGPGAADPKKVTAAYARVREDLRRLQLQVVCLNEVLRCPLTDPEGREREDSLDALAEDLGGMQAHFAYATPGVEQFGNAILVNQDMDVLGCHSQHLEGGSVVRTEGREKRIVRSALAVHLQPSATAAPVAVLATHWDHISERERHAQAQSFCGLLEDMCGGLQHVILGDLNTLKRSDYSDEEWATVMDRHRARGWAPPSDSEALRLLEGRGYVDLLQASVTGGRPLAAAPPERKLTTPTELPEIRVDFGYACPLLARCLRVGEAAVPFEAFVDRRASGSDHLPLCVELPACL